MCAQTSILEDLDRLTNMVSGATSHKSAPRKKFSKK
jgi:hypothetical protein